MMELGEQTAIPTISSRFHLLYAAGIFTFYNLGNTIFIHQFRCSLNCQDIRLSPKRPGFQTRRQKYLSFGICFLLLVIIAHDNLGFRSTKRKITISVYKKMDPKKKKKKESHKHLVYKAIYKIGLHTV